MFTKTYFCKILWWKEHFKIDILVKYCKILYIKATVIFYGLISYKICLSSGVSAAVAKCSLVREEALKKFNILMWACKSGD